MAALADAGDGDSGAWSALEWAASSLAAAAVERHDVPDTRAQA